MLKIIKLKIENMQENCVTDNKTPTISFALESDNSGVNLKNAVVSLNGWKKTVTDSINIVYDGKELVPFTKYKVKITATDNHNETAEAETEFFTGRLGTPWQAKWITDITYKFTQKKVSPVPMLFRKRLKFNKSIRRAKIYSTALGVYELKLNNKKIGGDYFAPGFTSYKNQLQYQVYDITEMLSGNDELTATVCGGWAVGKFTFNLRNRVYAKRQALLLELHVEYDDGTTQIIGTDDSWQVSRTFPLVFADFYDGEVYDSIIPISGIDWIAAGEEKVKLKPRYLATYGALTKAQETLKPVNSFKAKSGKIIYDFGQNFAGVVSIKLKDCKKNQVVTFEHAEIMLDGELFTKPLRSAKATLKFICNGSREQEYTPSFTYMGFRYVSVEGLLQGELEIAGIALYSDLEVIGHFECSNPLLNKLQSNIVWSAKSNFVDIPTDCPQRDERMGWTGDIALFSPTASFNFDTSRFYDKWLKDLRSEQKKTGGIPVTIPHVVFPSNLESVFTMAIDHWGDSCILVSWAQYKASGDVNILKKMYPSMKKYIKACLFWAGLFSVGKRRRIWSLGHHYGDWCAPNIGLFGWMRRGKWTATACLANSCNIMHKIAVLLGEQSDARRYQKLALEVSAAYQDILTDGKGKLKKEFQTAYVLPLVYGIFKGNTKQMAAQNLARLVEQNNYNIATGFPATPHILFALCDNGQSDAAFKMLLKEDCPSWLYQIKAGATTLWERWDALKADGTANDGDDGTNGMVSFNHYANGAVGNFLYRRIGGLEPIEAGYKKFKIKPVLGGGISYAKVSYDGPYGKIQSSWQIKDGNFNIEITVPAGTECVLVLPSGEKKTLKSGNHSYNQLLSKSGVESYE